jgi:hypothetical protein
VDLSSRLVSGDGFGSSTLFISDMNNDFIPEMLVGSMFRDSSVESSGAVTLMFVDVTTNPLGLSLSKAVDIGFAMPTTTSHYITVPGTPSEYAMFGKSMDYADVNLDGVQDLIVGAPGSKSRYVANGGNANNWDYAGAVYVLGKRIGPFHSFPFHSFDFVLVAFKL